MKKIVISALFALFITSLGFSQVTKYYENTPGVEHKTLPFDEINTKDKKPFPNQYVREADIMWAKIVWRRVEFSEKMNQIFYFPKQPTNGYRSLIQVLLDAISHSNLKAYRAKPVDAGQEFTESIYIQDINPLLGAQETKQTIPLEDGRDSTITIKLPPDLASVKSLLIKEIWFFDKQRSVMDVRIIGLCPVREYYRETDVDHTEPLYKKVFWVYYPEARPFLAQAPVYMPYNDLKSLTYDDIFQKRLFSGYIYMISEPQQREIIEYEEGLNVLLRSQEIENQIFNFEQSLWSY